MGFSCWTTGYSHFSRGTEVGGVGTQQSHCQPVQATAVPGADKEDLEGRSYNEEEERCFLSLDLPVLG